MKRLMLVLVALAVFATPALARDRVLESQTKSYPAKDLKSVRLEFSVGELNVEGSNSDAVRVTLRIHCKRYDDEWCDEQADEVELDAYARGDRLLLEIDGHSWWGDADDYWIEADVQIPSHLELEIDMGVGELEVEGMEGDLDVSLKVGEASVRMPESKVGRVYAKVSIGEASLNRRDGRQSVSGFLGRQLRWSNGAGRARVDVNVGVGELSLRLI